MIFAMVWGAGCGAELAGADSGGVADAGVDASGAVDAGAVDASAPEAPRPDGGSTSPARLCNGHAALCDRPYDRVAYAATHNAHASTSRGFSIFNANQERTLTEQLEAGVRAMLIDVHDDGGVPHLCHGPCFLGKLLHTDGLQELRAFLDSAPNEVLTLIYEDRVPVDAIVADFEATGFDELVYRHAPGTPWPTLGEMIDANTRVVVTAEQGRPPPDWFHHVWEVAWDTPYSYRSASEFTCAPNRGTVGNDLFLVNHWVNTDVGLPSRSNAEQVNQYEPLLARAMECWEAADQLPNFIAVDFAETGDLIRVIDTLNGFEPSPSSVGGSLERQR